MKPDFERHIRESRARLVEGMNQIIADFGSPHRIGEDGKPYYDYSSISSSQIIGDIGGTFISDEQRLIATEALRLRLEGAIPDQDEATLLHGEVVSAQASWIRNGAGFLSKPEDRVKARSVLGLLSRVDALLPKKQPDETQLQGEKPHDQLIKKLRPRWITIKENSLGLSTQSDLDNADDALRFLSEVSGDDK